MSSSAEVNGSVSRHGRVRKKTAKLMEMEESETAPTAPSDRPVLTATPVSVRSSKKKAAKLRITIGGRDVTSDANHVLDESYVTVLDEPIECEEVVTEELIDPIPDVPVAEKTVPSLKIKLNAGKGTVELEDRTNTHSLKRKAAVVNGTEASDRKRGKRSPPVAPITSSDSIPALNQLNHGKDHSLSHNHTSNHSNQQSVSHDVTVTANPAPNGPLTPQSVGGKKKEKTAGSGKVTGKGSKSTPGSTVKRIGVTAYTLWCKENRPKVQKANPQMDFAAVSKALGVIWQQLSNNEKLQWKMKAEKIKNGPVLMRETGPPVADPLTKPANTALNATPTAGSARMTSSGATAAATVSSATKAHYQPVRRITPSVKSVKASSGSNARVSKKAVPDPVTWMQTGVVSPVDAASYLKILGESMSSMGRRMSDQRYQVAGADNLTGLLDAALCALGPLIALTSLHPRLDGCDPSTHTKTLQNLSFIMPDV